MDQGQYLSICEERKVIQKFLIGHDATRTRRQHPIKSTDDEYALYVTYALVVRAVIGYLKVIGDSVRFRHGGEGLGPPPFRWS